MGSRFVDEGVVDSTTCLLGLDCLVVANPDEPMGRTVVEAQFVAIPPVVPDAGGASELVEDGATGLVYQANSADSLATALRWLIENPGAAAQIGRRAHAAVTARHREAPQYAASYLALLRA